MAEADLALTDGWLRCLLLRCFDTPDATAQPAELLRRAADILGVGELEIIVRGAHSVTGLDLSRFAELLQSCPCGTRQKIVCGASASDLSLERGAVNRPHAEQIYD